MFCYFLTFNEVIFTKPRISIDFRVDKNTHEYNAASWNRIADPISRATKSRREFDCTTLALVLMRARLRSSKGHRGPSNPHDTITRP